jgi:hypothetical protein
MKKSAKSVISSSQIAAIVDSIALQSTFAGYMIDELRTQLRSKLATGKSSCCVLCNQTTKLYPRKLRGTWIGCLRELYRRGALTPQQMIAAAGAAAGRDYPGLTYFGLAHVNPADNLWRISQLGVDFLRGLASVNETAMVYNGELVGLAGREVTIRDFEDGRRRFDLSDLMDRAPFEGAL